MNKAELQVLQSYLQEMGQIFSQDADVHKYTGRLGNICRIFIENDNKYAESLKDAPGIDTIIGEILAVCPEAKRANVNTALTSIRNSTAPDGETGLPLQELLTRTWMLSKTYINGKLLICDNLSHNLETGGGCLPGIAARLVQPYTAFLYEYLERQVNNYSATRSNVEPRYVTDASSGHVTDDIDLVLTLSRLEYEQNQKKQQDNSLELALNRSKVEYRNSTYAGTTGTAADDFDLALALSISEYEQSQKKQQDRALELSLNRRNREQRNATGAGSAYNDDDLNLALGLSLSEQSQNGSMLNAQSLFNRTQANRAREDQISSDEKLAKELHHRLNMS